MRVPDDLRRKKWFWGVLLLALTCVVYLPVRNAGFLWDDKFMVVGNDYLRSRKGLFDIWFSTKPVDHIPITLSALWLEYQLWGVSPSGYHVVNVMMHALGAILLWRVLLRLRLPGAWLAAAIFAVHPVCVASAAWVSEQKNTISLVFYLWTIICYLQFEEKPTQRNYTISLAVFVVTLLTKGSVVVLPPVLMLLIWWKNRRVKRADFLRLSPFFVLAFAEGLTTIWFQNHHAIGDETVQVLNHAEQSSAASRAVWFYLWKTCVPWNLMAVYPQWSINWKSAIQYLPALAIVTVLVIAWKFRATWGRHVLFALTAFMVTLFPVMGFFNMYFLVFSRVADHLQYLAMLVSIPLVVCSLVYLVRKWKLPRSAVIGIAIVVLSFLSISTYVRAGIYTNEEKLWTDTIAKNPNAWIAYNNLGYALGNPKDTPESIAAYRRALELKPDLAEAHSNLGVALVEQYKGLKHQNQTEADAILDDALHHLAEAIALKPSVANTHFSYAVGLVAKGNLDQAIKEYETALDLRSDFADCRNNLIHALLQANRAKEALEQAMRGVQIDNSAQAHCNLGSAYHMSNDLENAKREFDTALAMNPSLTMAHYECGIMLAMSGRLEESLPYLIAYVHERPEDGSAHGNLGTIYASLHRLDEALAEYQTALKINPNDGDAEKNIQHLHVQMGKIQGSDATR